MIGPSATTTWARSCSDFLFFTLWLPLRVATRCRVIRIWGMSRSADVIWSYCSCSGAGWHRQVYSSPGVGFCGHGNSQPTLTYRAIAHTHTFLCIRSSSRRADSGPAGAASLWRPIAPSSGQAKTSSSGGVAGIIVPCGVCIFTLRRYRFQDGECDTLPPRRRTRVRAALGVAVRGSTGVAVRGSTGVGVRGSAVM